MTSVQIVNPALPFWNPIPGGLSVGTVIQIQGIFPTVFDVSQYSKIELCEQSGSTILFHMSIRFNHRKVVRNTLERSTWQHEETDGPFPFGEGMQFLIQIVVQPHCYQVSVNDHQCWTYNHRLPYSMVTHLNIGGPLIIWNVKYTSNAQVQMGNFLFSPVPSAAVRLVSKPRLPYWGNLPQSLAVGNVIEIKGSFPASLDRSQYTAINLCQDSKSTIAFHLSIRFNNNVAIRNTYRQGTWETEEKGGPFPFSLGKEFLIKIVVQQFDYQISVNAVHCWSFPHRLPFGMVNGLDINGPVNIQHVDYTSNMGQPPIFPQQQPMYSPPSQPMCSPPPQPMYSPLPQAPMYPEPPSSHHSVYNPSVPFSYHINGGIKPNMMIYISGIPFVNFHRFTISLQCGQQQSCPDIAFQFDVRGYNGTVSRNTRRNNRWEDEETAARIFPFHSSVPFDMMILVQNDKYRVAISGAHFIEYYHRITRLSRINFLKIENDVRITSIRFSD